MADRAGLCDKHFGCGSYPDPNKECYVCELEKKVPNDAYWEYLANNHAEVLSWPEWMRGGKALAGARLAAEQEGRSWKGVLWKDSVAATNLAEEIAQHFDHKCADELCTEDADEETCEFSWVEAKLQNFLDALARVPDHPPVEKQTHRPVAYSAGRGESYIKCSCGNYNLEGWSDPVESWAEHIAGKG